MIMYNQLCSTKEECFVIETTEIRTVHETVGAALVGKTVTYLLDSQFDDVAVWSTVWTQGHHLVCRVHHRDRLVRAAANRPVCRLEELAPQLQPLARVETAMVVRKGKQARPKLQPVTAVVAAVPLVVAYQERLRTRADGARHDRPVWLVEVRLDGAHEEPWWLLTDRPVTTAEEAAEVFRMYRQRWAIEMSQPHCPHTSAGVPRCAA